MTRAEIGTKSHPIDFDHNLPKHSQAGPELIYKQLRAQSPVAWSDSNGGYWVVSGHEELAVAASNPEVFSSALSMDLEGHPQGGIFIPAEKGLVPMIPTEIDPPEWRDYRMIFAKRFTPAACKEMAPMIARLTTEAIDRIIETGKCDMVLDIAGPVPASGILILLELDEREWEGYGEPFHDALGYPPGSVKFNEALVGLENVVNRIRELVRESRKSGAGELMQTILATEINGEPITDDGATSVIYSLFSGGVDTTTTFLANTFAHLSRNPEDRNFLIEDPARIKLATEEFMRAFSPVQALGRTVTEQTTLGGQTLEKGDRVLLAWASANRDERLFENPDKCILDRYPNRHVGFGMGIHRCAGAHFARMQIEIVLRQVLERMPDFVIEEERSSQYPNIGVVNGWVQMPATFTPSARLG
jgi:cytochrome P450